MTASASESAPASPRGRHFFEAADFDFSAQTVVGHAAQGVIDFGLVLATLGRIEDGNPDSWFTAWLATAQKLHAEATRCRKSGNTYSAGALFLAAAEGYDQALAFVDGMTDQSVLLPTFRTHRECWDEFVESSGDRYVTVAVPYEGDSMPGYLLRPDDSGAARPTVVVTNGSDGALTGLWATVARGSLARGWNVFVFDGPGQQSMLFERDVPFRHDWEAVLTPVVDFLVRRGDVDGTQLLAYGISQGGYWVSRALAFEHRFVAAVVDGGVVDVGRTWYAKLPPRLLALLKAGDRETFNTIMGQFTDPSTEREVAFRSRPYGQPSPFDLFAELAKYTVHDVVGDITTPMMITDPDDEPFFPGQSRELFDALTCPKVLSRFSAEDGAGGHCEPMARQLLDLRLGDFFTGQLTR